MAVGIKSSLCALSVLVNGILPSSFLPIFSESSNGFVCVVSFDSVVDN